MPSYRIEVLAGGEVQSDDTFDAVNDDQAESHQTELWNAECAHTDRYESRLYRGDQLIMTIGGDEEEGE